MKRAVITALGRVLLTCTLIVGFLAVTAEVVSALTPPNYFVTATGGSTGLFNCHNFAAANACSLSRALSLATAPADVIHMQAGTYNAAGNDVINTLTGLSALNNGVTIKGAAGLGTILEPAVAAADCLGQPGIIDFSPVSNMTIQRVKVDFSAASGCANPVYNSGGSGDTLGALPNSHRVIVTGAPVTGADLVGGSTTLTDVWMRPPSSYTGTGVLCTGATTTCTVSRSRINGASAPGTSGVVVSASAVASVTNSIIANNTSGGTVFSTGASGTVSGSTLSGDTAGGVLLEGATSAETITHDTFTSDAGGGVVATGTGNQSAGTTVSNSTFSGTMGAGVELEETGGFTINSNTVSGLGSGGEGFILVASDNNAISGNTVTSSAAGVFVTGNDILGASTGNTVSNNALSNNLLAGAAADGFGSPESWNKPGTGQQGIQGEVFFQSSVAVPLGTITSVCPDSSLPTCVEVDTPAGMGSVTGAYAGVAGYLAEAGEICPTAVTVDPPNGGLSACTDGNGDIFLFGSVSSAISAGNGEATGSSTTGEPGCELSPPSNTGAPSCTGTVLTLSNLPYITTVAGANTFNLNVWNNEAIAGAIDGSGPNGQLDYSTPTFVDGSVNAVIQTTWTNNVGSPAASPCNPTTTAPACGT
jgi:parallel beta-helix repeat protein